MITVKNLRTPQPSTSPHCFSYQIIPTHVVDGFNHLLLSHNLKRFPIHPIPWPCVLSSISQCLVSQSPQLKLLSSIEVWFQPSIMAPLQQLYLQPMSSSSCVGSSRRSQRTAYGRSKNFSSFTFNVIGHMVKQRKKTSFFVILIEVQYNFVQYLYGRAFF